MNIDDMCASWLHSGTPLDQVLDDAHFILHSHSHTHSHTHSPEHVETILDSLLTAVATQAIDPHMDTQVLTHAASVVLDYSALHASTVGSVLLNHLTLLPLPIPFIEIIPSLFGMASPLLLKEVFEQLHSLLTSDNQLILPVINALVDLPLSDELKSELVALTEEAIAIADESDVPFLFRTLLNNLDNINTANIAGRILSEVMLSVCVSVCE